MLVSSIRRGMRGRGRRCRGAEAPETETEMSFSLVQRARKIVAGRGVRDRL